VVENDDTIKIKFDKYISSKSFKTFKAFKQKKYVNVIDIKAKYEAPSRKLKLFRKMGAKIVKYPNRVRILIYSKFKYKISIKKFKQEMIIKVTKEKVKEEKKVIKVKPKINKIKELKKDDEKATAIIKKYKTIVIDPGHGGRDGGAVGYKKTTEKNVVFKISKILQKELNARGYIVILTREKDKFINLKERTKIANTYKSDIFISIHANAVNQFSKKKYSKNGIETYFLSDKRTKDALAVAKKENKASVNKMNRYITNLFLNMIDREKMIASNFLAIDIQGGMLDRVKKKYKSRDGGVREGPFWVLVGALMPSVLIEVGYLTNPTECKNLINPIYQKKLVRGIADGIDRFFIKNKL